MDLRGRRRSEITLPFPTGWDSHVRDVLEIAEHYGVPSFDLIGHSMGGFTGMSLATQHPRRSRRLSLIDAVGVPGRHALLSSAKSLGRLGQTYASVSGALSYMRAAGAITSWNGFSDSYFEWEPEPVDDGVRIRTDPGAVGEESPSAIDAVERFVGVGVS